MYQRPLTAQELYHHGILGQKWGVRRFQNPDGTLTDAGKKHKARADKVLKEGPKGKSSRLEKIARASNESVSEMQRANNKIQSSRTNKKANNEAKTLSDAELNKRIDRMAKEKRYMELKAQQDVVDNGSDKLSKALDVIGTVTVLASSAATIATAIYTIKKG